MKQPLPMLAFALVLAGALSLSPHQALAGDAGSISGTVTAKKKKYLPNTLVYVEKAAGTFAAPKKPVRIDQVGNQFRPTHLAVLKGSTVEYMNSDETDHSVFTPDGSKWDLGQWPKGESRKHTYDKLGTFTQLCKLHPLMLGYVFVVQNPYHALTDAQGNFKIAGVPPGKYTLLVWNERRQADRLDVEVTAGADASVTLALHR